MRLRVWLSGLSVLLCSAGAEAAVYKWTDLQGRVHYDDSRLHEQKLTLDYLNRRGIPARAEATVPAAFVAEVSQRCQLALDRADNYRKARSVEAQDPAGNRYTLSARQVQIEIAQAEAAQQQYCGPDAAQRLYQALLRQDRGEAPAP